MEKENNDYRRVSVYVVFMDIVGFSKIKGDEKQKKAVENMISIVKETEFYESLNNHYAVMYGDGLLLVIPEYAIDNPYDILNFVSESQILLKKKASISIRTGVNCGKALQIDGIQHPTNYIGSVINDTQRVMNFGDSDHILLHHKFYEDLKSLNPDKLKKFKIENLGKALAKHHQIVSIYNYKTKEAGNSSFPKRVKKQFLIVNNLQDQLATLHNHMEDFMKDLKIDPEEAKLRISILLYDSSEKRFLVSPYRYQHEHGFKKFPKPKVEFKNDDNPVWKCYNEIKTILIEPPEKDRIKWWVKEYKDMTEEFLSLVNRPSECYLYVPLFLQHPQKKLRREKDLMKMGVMCIDSLCSLPNDDKIDEIIELTESYANSIDFLLTALD